MAITPDTPPHPTADSYWITVWVYRCPGCGGTYKVGWSAPCSEDGSILYCGRQACGTPGVVVTPQVEGGRAWFKNSFHWCARGHHVMTESRCPSGTHDQDRIAKAQRQHRRYTCAHCQTEFTPTRSDAKFCSGRCRVAAHRADA